MEELEKLNITNKEWNELLKECSDRDESYCNKYDGKDDCYNASKLEKAAIETEIEFTEDEDMLEELNDKLKELEAPCWYVRYMYNGNEFNKCVKKIILKNY